MGRKTPPQFPLTIEHIVFGGEGMGYFENRPVFVYGVFPGEEVVVAPIKVNSRFVKARLVSVTKSSPKRIPALEEHHLTCSPWQTISYDEQVVYKTSMVKSMWEHMTKDVSKETLTILPSDEQWNYRNKLEFSVIEGDGGGMQLAFHKRYRHSQYYGLDKCVLGMPQMNTAATALLGQLQDLGVTADMIKNILVRGTNTGDVVAVVYAMTKKFPDVDFSKLSIQGGAVVYSDPKSPVAKTDEVLLSFGILDLTESVNEKKLTYGYESFFQVHTPMFTKLIQELKKHLPKSIPRLLDLYSGVGTIGIALSDIVGHITAIENHSKSKYYAEINFSQNGINNFDFMQIEVEKSEMHDLFTSHDVICVDPPRAGLHPKVSEMLSESGSDIIVYVSCNPATQARDWNILKKNYIIKTWYLVDMYPQTPHVESVLVLKRT
ncbi:MAG: 23S rRNA (uracil(1939)-C(5))-methyltransferase RlmD [Patescibacteria group bacterium]